MNPTNGNIRFKFAGSDISATTEVDKDGDYGFSIKTELTQQSLKALGQVILLIPQDGSPLIPMGIGNLNTDRLPYHPKVAQNQ